ncbi:immunoglobulin-like and fibronectin type III domain-containing protein 1 [Amblyraja radiata]|uniref:immunoglobulin-like and fibronectin type III domain-containing protein 1 n=1 Tax=Amblyraja radiata TaxID=386614 RepID=UPI00140379B4|nr:immunoglobulin-like and fibronectin type III domain-containing protein 1 [Amblyraja radiata]
MDKKVINQAVKSTMPGAKIKKSSVPGVTLVEFTENIPEGCSAPDIERRPISLTMQEGKIANFKALVRGNPKPTVVWSFKEDIVTDENNYKIYQDKATNEYILQVKKLSSEHAGSYRCVFSNEYGEARCVTHLNIIEVGFKRKLKKPGQIQEKVQDPVDFRKMLKKCAQPVKKEDDVDNQKIWEVLMNADKKDYERICMQYGLTDFRGMLTRLKQMKIEREEKQAEYVKSITNLKHIETKADGSANFGFDMELKNPNLTIFLFKDHQMIPYSMTDDGKHNLNHVGKQYNFSIKDLQPDDVGMYKINVEDASIFATEVDFNHIPVHFKQPLQECKCNEAEDAVFQCTISVPIPVEWAFKKRTLESSDKYHMTVSPDGLTHCLTVKGVLPVDKGVYVITAGAGSSSAYLIVGKNLGGTSSRSGSGKGSLDIKLEQDLDSLKKDGSKGTGDRLLHDNDLTKDDSKGRNDLSEDAISRFGRGGLQDSEADGSYGDSINGIGEDGRMGKDGSGVGSDGLGRMGQDDICRLDGNGKDHLGRLGGMGKDGKGGLGGMNKDGNLIGLGKDREGSWDGLRKGGMDSRHGIGKDMRGNFDRMGVDGADSWGGMEKDGKSSVNGMGKYGKDSWGGMGMDGKGHLGGMDGTDIWDGMGKDGKGSLHGMGREGMGIDGKGRLGGMGKDGINGLERSGKCGKEGLDGIGKYGIGGLDGIGKGMAGLNGMGTLGGIGMNGKGSGEGMGKDEMGKDGKGSWDGVGKDQMDGMGKDGKDSWDAMGKDGKTQMDGMGKDGKDSWDAMGKDGKAQMDGMGMDGKDRLDGSGITGMKDLDGKNILNTSGWNEMQNNLETDSNQGQNGLAGPGDSAFAGVGGAGQVNLNDIDVSSMGGTLSRMSGSAGAAKDGRASLAADKAGLLGDNQMSIQGESMTGRKQDLLASDLSQEQQSSSTRKRKGKLSESDLAEDQKHRSKAGAHYFKTGLSDMDAQKGAAAELSCVMKNEEAQGSWFKDGVQITSGNGRAITKEGAVHKLTLAHVQDEDSGTYTFEAGGGRTEALLFVKDPPGFDQDVLDQLGKKPIVVKAGQSAAVKVPFTGKPPIKVSWCKDGDELFIDNRIKIDNIGDFTRLSISNCNRKDSGTLTVKLKNESGTSSANISLCVTDKPQAPQGPVEVLESSEGCISFKWKPPKDDGGKPIENYIIERQIVGRNTWTKVGELDGSQTTYSFTKMEPGKNYKFKVWAVNSEGASEALLSEAVSAGRRDVPGPVPIPKILNANSKSVTLTWTPPKKSGGSRVIGYMVEKRKKSSNTWSVVTDAPVTEKKWTVTDVVEGLEYEFRVTAVNSSGLGEPSCETDSVFAREPMKLPGAVRDLEVTDSTHSTITLAWTPPIYQGNEAAKGYIVEMKSSGSTTWTRCNTVPVGLTSYTMKNLKAMGMYFLRVRAVNDGGLGEPLELDNYVLAMPPPVTPKFRMDETFKSFMIIKEGNSLQVQMPFQASPFPEIIWVKDGLPLSKHATVTNTNAGTQLFISACQRSDSGIYSIILKNAFGQDSFSFEIRATAIPKPPGPLTLNDNVPNTVTVSWESSTDELLDDHLHYVVMKRDSGRPTWHTVGDNIFNNKFTVLNIIPGRKYYFKVLAKNDMGCSEPSDTQEPWCVAKQKDHIALKVPNKKGVNNMSAPQFTVKLKTHIATPGSDVCMSCSVKGHPPPNVTWFKNNTYIGNYANFWSTNVCGVCSLCIFNASPRENGEYMVMAENSAGKATCSTRLTIRE